MLGVVFFNRWLLTRMDSNAKDARDADTKLRDDFTAEMNKIRDEQRADNLQTRNELKEAIAGNSDKIDATRTELLAEDDKTRTELKAEDVQSRADLKTEIQSNSDKIDATRTELKTEMQDNADKADASRAEMRTDIQAVSDRVNQVHDAVKDTQADVRVLQVQVESLDDKVDRLERADSFNRIERVDALPR